MQSTNPARTGEVVAEVLLGDAATFVDAARAARAAQKEWARVPAPVRGRVIAQVGRLVEANKEALARLVTREIGKPYPESLGEVQEIVDTCDFFLGEGRRLYGQTVPVGDARQAAVHASACRSASRRSSPRATSRSRCRPGTSCRRILCGNAVVWKPAEYARRWATRWPSCSTPAACPAAC